MQVMPSTASTAASALMLGLAIPPTSKLEDARPLVKNTFAN